MIAGAGGNIGVQIGPDGVVLVDAGAKGTSAQVLAEIRKLTDRPIRYIINTSADPDHAGGNAELSKAGQTIFPLGGSARSDFIKAMTGAAASILAEENVLKRMSGRAAEFSSDAWPTETYYQKRKYIYFNHEGIEILHQPAAHTDGDSVVFFRISDVVVAGDVLDTTRFPVIDLQKGGGIQGEIDALNQLIELAIPPGPFIFSEGGTYIIPGHGRLYDQADVVEYRDMIVIIRDVIKDADAARNDARTDPGRVSEQTMRAERQYGSESGPWTTHAFVEGRVQELGGKHQVRSKLDVSKWSGTVFLLAATAALFSLPVQVHAQGRGGRGGPPVSPKAAAPIDLTGYWVSLITEDWRYRMVTPAKGDYMSIPMTMESKTVADAWDPAKDEAAGNQCKSYGAPVIMRLPERVHISWQDDTTLRVEIDAGTQTRLFHFGDWKAPGGEPTWQGDSLAQWEVRNPGRGGGANAGPPKSGSLKVATTHFRSGYLRKNGVPYSENAALTEYYDVVRERNGDPWLIVTTVVRDPRYLQQPFITSSQFKKEADAAKWDPACSSTVVIP